MLINSHKVVSENIVIFNSSANVCKELRDYINDDLSLRSNLLIEWKKEEMIKKESLISLETCLSNLLQKGYLFFDVNQEINPCDYKKDSLKVNDLLRFNNMSFFAIQSISMDSLETIDKHCIESKYGAMLYKAASEGNFELVQDSINKYADINFFDAAGGTAIYVAAQRGDIKIVKYLIGKQANLEITSVFGLSPIYVSVVNRHYEVAKLLLEAGASTESSIPSGYTALCVAAHYGYTDFIELLLDYGAKSIPEIINKDIIQIAKDNGHSEVEQFIANYKDKKQIIINDLLFIAAQTGNYLLVEKQISKGADVNAIHKIGATSLYLASQNGYGEIVNLLLQNNAETEISWNGQTPLFAAVTNKHAKIAEMLLESGADTEAKHSSGSTSLFVAVNNGDKESANVLLRYNANVEVKVEGYPMIYVAVNHGDADIVELLLEYKASTDIKINGFNVLYVASKFGFIGIVKALIDAGMNVQEAQINGKTALDVAAENGHTQIVKLLLHEGANIGFTQKLIFNLLLAEEKQKFDESQDKDAQMESCLQANIENSDYVKICGLDKFSVIGDEL